MGRQMARALLIVSLAICAAVILAVAITSAEEPAAPIAASGSGVTTGSVAGETPLAAVVPGGPGFISQTAMAFRPHPDQRVPYNYGDAGLSNPDTSAHYYRAAVQLPHGATITKFVAWYRDDNAISDLWVALVRGALESPSGAQMARVDSTGTGAAVRYAEDTTIGTPVVNNQAYVYWVELYLPANSVAVIMSFRIDYSYPVALPLVTTN